MSSNKAVEIALVPLRHSQRFWNFSARTMASEPSPGARTEKTEAGSVEEQSFGAAEEGMDSRVWADLPDELVVAILSRLPWWSNLRFRTVCRSWSAMLRDAAFLALTVSPPAERSPFCVANSVDGGLITMFDPLLSRSVVFKQSWLLSESAASFDALDMKAVAGGLFVIKGTVPGSPDRHRQQQANRDLLIVNPLNGTQRLLPTLPDLGPGFSCHIIGMSVDKAMRNCRVIAVQSQELLREIEERPRRIGRFYYLPVGGARTMWKPINHSDIWTIYMYESKSNSWDPIFSLQKKVVHNLVSATLVNDELYLLTLRQSWVKPIYRIFRAIATDWEELPVPPEFVAQDLVCVHLFEHQGCLMLVGATKDHSERGSKDCLTDRPPNVNVWRLDQVEEWKKVASMPEEMVRTLVRLARREVNFHKRLFNESYKQAHRTDSFDFFAEGDYLIFSNIVTERAIICNIVRKEWTIIPRLQCTCWKFHGYYQPTFLYQPSLDMVL